MYNLVLPKIMLTIDTLFCNQPCTGSLPIFIVEKEELTTFKARLPNAPRNWLESNRASLDKRPLVLPNEKGQPFGVVSLNTLENSWDLAVLCQTLPGGCYHLKNEHKNLEQLCVGWALEHYCYNTLKSDVSPPPLRQLVWPKGVNKTRVCALVQAHTVGRDLINTPANLLTPQALGEAVKALGADFHAHVELFEGNTIERDFPALAAVGRATNGITEQAPRFVDLRWGDTGPLFVLIGKGLCYDTGGLNLKPGGSMALMKKDMGGAAHAMALARMIMQTGLKCRLRLLVPIAENAVSSTAMRPGDIIATRKGLSVEVGNTDAEGRLVLADALSYATELKPDLVLDFATLTGAARVALGPDIPAYFTNDQKLAYELETASIDLNDPLWRLPLYKGYNTMLTSDWADLNNAPASGMAGAITAALFLERFAPQIVPWAHFDVYGWYQKSRPGRSVGGAIMGLSACYAALESYV